MIGHYLTLSKWRPNFKPGNNEVQTTMVWLRFPQLPLEMFGEATLLGIANGVGNAVRLDPIIVEMIKTRYARVCVELDLNGPLSLNVLVWSRKQDIEYEDLHHICFACGRYSYKKEGCMKLSRTSWGGGINSRKWENLWEALQCNYFGRGCFPPM